MSDSPQSNPKDVEQGAPSGDEEAQMNDPQDPHSTGLGYEFEVKEQDRWLPIANGTSRFPFIRCFSGASTRHDSRARAVAALSHRRLRSACMAARPSSLTGVASPPAALPIAYQTTARLPTAGPRPCRAIRRPSRRRRRPALPHHRPKRTRLTDTMLTFATLPQSPAS